MFKFLRKKKAQSTLEYAVLIIIVIGALLSIQVYIKRGIQGRLRQASDDIGSQYSVGNWNSVKTTKFSSNTMEKFGVDGIGVSNSWFLDDETTEVTLNEEMINGEQEWWG